MTLVFGWFLSLEKNRNLNYNLRRGTSKCSCTRRCWSLLYCIWSLRCLQCKAVSRSWLTVINLKLNATTSSAKKKSKIPGWRGFGMPNDRRIVYFENTWLGIIDILQAPITSVLTQYCVISAHPGPRTPDHISNFRRNKNFPLGTRNVRWCDYSYSLLEGPTTIHPQYRILYLLDVKHAVRRPNPTNIGLGICQN